MKDTFVLIDFDGVVVDTFDICFRLNGRIRPDFTVEQYRAMFEGNIYDELKREGRDKIDMRSANDAFFKDYIPLMLKRPPVEGVIDVFRELAKEHTLIIVSSSVNSPIETYLETHNIRSAFHEVMGADVHRSKTKKIQMVFENYKTTSERCVFITDTLGDMREAAKVDVASIGVSWGFHSHETLGKGLPFSVADHPKELPDAVQDFFANVHV